MKKALIFLCLAFFFHASHGQNAFYDARRLKLYFKNNTISVAQYIIEDENKIHEINKEFDDLSKPIVKQRDSLKTLINQLRQDSIRAKPGKIKIDSAEYKRVDKQFILLQKQYIPIVDSLKRIIAGKQDSLNTIFSYYFKVNISNNVLVLEKMANNPFFEKLGFDGTVTGGGGPNILTAATQSLGSLNVANLADGIAQFLIKRGKEELNVAFFNRMKNFLEDTVHPECKTLFPATTAFLENIASYQYAELIQSLREAFHTDLANLIVNLNQLIDLPKFQTLLKNLPEIRAAVRSAKIVSELSQSSTNKPLNPAVVIDHLSALSEWQDIHPNLANSWKLLSVISKSVLNKDTAYTWITLSDLNNLMNDPIELNLFLGLIYEQAAGIQFTINGSTTSVQQFMKDNISNIYAVSSLIENFSLLANDVDRTIADLKEKKTTPSNDDYYTYINKAINIVEYGFKVANQIKPGIVDNQYIVIAKNANDLYKSIYTKNYSSAAMNLYSILDQVFNRRDNLAKERLARVALPGAADSAAISSTMHTAITNSDLPDPKIIGSILKYANFIAVVVKAQSGDEVEKAIEAAALPAGSYSIKQSASWNISLNGYIGYGWDFNQGHGVYAPIGFSFSTRLYKNGWTGSLFISLIDVGSVASYRLTSGTTDSLKQEIRLESIFSPGLQLMLEIPKTPITFFSGWRLTPRQFYSKQNGFTVFDSKSAINAGIVIDIPILTLHNKSIVANSTHTP